MSKLLRANFARLWKFKPFWVCLVLAFAFSAIINIEIPEDISWIYKTGYLIINGGSISMIFTAVFVPLFLGTDYSCGTIRNKLAVGYSRENVYLANLITVASGALFIRVVCAVPPVFKAIVWGVDLGMPTSKLLLDIGITVWAMIASSAALTLLGMVVTEKSHTTVLTILMTLVLLFGSRILLETMIQQKIFLSVGEVSSPFLDVLPYGQMVCLEKNQLHEPEFYPLYSFAVLSVTTAAGMLIFRKKDLK